MKYLRNKEEELRTVLRRLDQKNNEHDGKDMLIGKLHALINKIESDGRALLERLRANESKQKEVKETVDEMNRDKAFIVEKIRKEKRKSRQ